MDHVERTGGDGMTTLRVPIAVEPVSIEKPGGEQVRLSIEHYRGYDLVDLRLWYVAKGGELRPSPKGVALPLARWPEFVQAVYTMDVRLSAAKQEALSE